MGIAALKAGLIASYHADRRNPQRTPLRRAKDGSYRTAEGRTATHSQRDRTVMWVDAIPEFQERTS